MKKSLRNLAPEWVVLVILFVLVVLFYVVSWRHDLRLKQSWEYWQKTNPATNPNAHGTIELARH